jgi:hypothetical protein
MKKSILFIFCNFFILVYIIGQIEGACIDWSKADKLGDPDASELILEYCN